MSSLSSSIRRVDMYNRSRRHNATQACPLYCGRMVIQWLGPGAFHECDESCWHLEVCSRCKFSLESDNGLDWMCLILEVLVSERVSFSRAYDLARERIKGGD
jgi:hypothetical protein